MSRAFTLIELIIATIILSILVSLAIPMFSDHDAGRLAAAKHRLWADIQYAQAWTIANPSNPATIRFLADGYIIAGPPDGGTVRFTSSSFSEANGVKITVTDVPPGGIPFNHSGALDVGLDAREPRIQLSTEGGVERIDLVLQPTSGQIRLENAIGLP
ncbi:MAG: prepilin-type N-terminal cleavage/methylation domain-containing protein [Phycisphaerales bacterium]|nr:prepilin-type N-terminal cleavage/methylation domain-containing protein [Phycisphaerales bacterium]